MSEEPYSDMQDDRLFLALESAVIDAHDSFTSGASTKKQHRSVDNQNAIQEEIQRRGEDTLRNYVPLLTAPHPAVRLAAAFGLRKSQPKAIEATLEELASGRYTGTITLDATMALRSMRSEGIL